MIDCTRFERMFPESVAGKLSVSEAAQFAEHQLTCKHCAAFSQSDAYFRMRLQTVGFEPNVPNIDLTGIRKATPKTKSVIMDFPMRSLSLAAGIALGAIIAGKAIYNFSALPTANTVTAQVRTFDSSKQTASTQYAGIDTHRVNARIKDSLRNLQGTLPLPNQFPGDLQAVSGR